MKKEVCKYTLPQFFTQSYSNNSQIRKNLLLNVP